ncbi:MAG: hypothetical protein KC502_23870 [Myxococcales bacterium]|nr:hypothetical protein [Myxococcales bacterium]
MATPHADDLPPLHRCRHCRSWQRRLYVSCLYCGKKLEVRRSAAAITRAPALVLITLLSMIALVASVVMATKAVVWMSTLTFFVCWLIIAYHVAPRSLFTSSNGPRYQAEICFNEVREDIKSGLKGANAAGDPAGVSRAFALLLWRTTLLRETNRAVPLLYGRQVAHDRSGSSTGRLKKTIERLNEIDGEWLTSRLAEQGSGAQATRALSTLLKAAKARPRMWLERLQKQDLGSPMPGVDIEAQLLAIAEERSELQARSLAAQDKAPSA